MEKTQKDQIASAIKGGSDQLVSVLRGGTKVTYLVASRIIVFTTLGVMITLGLLILLYPQIHMLITEFELTLPVILKIVVLALFTIGAPVVYFFFAKAHGIQVAVFHAIRENKSLLTEFIVQKLFELAEQNQELMQALQKSQLQAHSNTLLKIYQEYITTLVWPIRVILLFLIRRVHILDVVCETIDEHEISQVNRTSLQQVTVAKVNDCIDETFSPPHLWGFLGLVLGHAAIIFLVKLYYLS